MVILFLICFMGGGFWGNRQGEFGQYATAASQQEILFGQHFGQLNDRLTNLGNGVCNLGFEMQGGIGQLGKEVALAQANEIQQLRDKVNALQMDNRMYGVVRYPNGYTYTAGPSPFCGFGSCA